MKKVRSELEDSLNRGLRVLKRFHSNNNSIKNRGMRIQGLGLDGENKKLILKE